MLAYAAKRLALLPLGLLIVVSLSFALVNLAPGDPARAIAGGLATEETLAEIRAELGLDKPLGTRYVGYIESLLKGDLGTSYFTRRTVADEVTQRLPDSLELIVMSLGVAVVLGLVLGGIGAYYRGRWPDTVSRLLTSAIQSIPDFFLGLSLIYFLFFVLGWAPAPVGRIGLLDTRPPRVTGGLLTDAIIAGDWKIFWTGVRHSIMPVLALGIYYAAYFAKTARATLSSAFASRQVEFARACGLPPRAIWMYAFREARTPILTYGAILFAVLIGGAAIVEMVFGWGGVGEWAVGRILALDIPAIQGFVVVAAVVTLLTYIALDLLVAALDPRIKYQSGGAR
jgi:ABC-type dipeptide/oligopeptide/nickel transport system permease component